MDGSASTNSRSIARRTSFALPGWTVVCVTILLSGCGGETGTKPQQTSNNGAITGRVVPNPSGAVVRLDGDEKGASVDAEGNFAFTELESGSYTLIVESPQYSTRTIRGILVRDDITVVMGDVKLSSFPAPFFDSNPENGSVGISLWTGVLDFYSDEPIASEALRSATTIMPPLAFQWRQYPYGRDGWSYRYQLSFGYAILHVGTEHVITIDNSLEMDSGASLDKDLVLRFTTEPLKAAILTKDGSIPGNVSLREPELYIEINGDADTDSLDAAVMIEPLLPGRWVPYSRTGPSRYYIFDPDGYIGADIEYSVQLGTNVALVDSLRLDQPVTHSFHTEPHRVLSVFPRDGEVQRPMGVSANIFLEFNAPVDVMSVESAIRITTSDTSDLVWDFIPTNSGYRLNALSHTLPPSGAHVFLSIDTTLRFLDEGNLPEPFSSEFTIQ